MSRFLTIVFQLAILGVSAFTTAHAQAANLVVDGATGVALTAADAEALKWETEDPHYDTGSGEMVYPGSEDSNPENAGQKQQDIYQVRDEKREGGEGEGH
jgi:hypothetical protein